MQLGPLLLCAFATLGGALFSPTARADENDDVSADSSKSEESDSDSDESKESSRSERPPEASDREGESGAAPRFEIALTTTLAGYARLSFVLDVPVVGETNGSIANTGFGPSANPVTLEIGYLLGGQFSVGALIEAGSTSTHTVVEGPDPLDIDDTQTLGRLMVGPRVSYVFSDSGALRPFVMAAIGVTYAPQQASAGSRSIALTGFEAIGGAGLHWFLSPSFSVDLALRGGYGLGSGHVEETYPVGTDATGMTIEQTSNVPVHGSLVTGQVLLGLSGWL